MQALMQPVPARADLAARSRPLRTGEPIDLDELSDLARRVTATSGSTRSNCPANSPAAAASSTSSRPTPTPRIGWNCSATRSNRSASSPPDTQRSLRDLKSASVLALTATPSEPEA